ncbi:MAG: MarR family winged helix-turn-helix transcriptional regulator [Candidatus Bathyarchaeia archaeon]|jgi:DNA-binding MarR family transcriptional regulator
MEQNLVKPSADGCAREVLDVVPLVMRGIREQLRKHGARVLSVPQFRTLLFINRRKGTSLSEVAEHIGLTLPSMSTLIDGLVGRNLAVRRTDPDDRRRMTLTLTERGQASLQIAREATQAHLAEHLGHLTEQERKTIITAMQLLRSSVSESSA